MTLEMALAAKDYPHNHGGNPPCQLKTGHDIACDIMLPSDSGGPRYECGGSGGPQ